MKYGALFEKATSATAGIVEIGNRKQLFLDGRFADVADDVTLTVEDDAISVTPRGKSKRARQQWGMSRTMIANLVTGVSAERVRDEAARSQEEMQQQLADARAEGQLLIAQARDVADRFVRLFPVPPKAPVTFAGG